jgi:gas vesicle protein
MKRTACFLLAGALAGAAVALLYAPKSGDQTKKDIKQFAKKTANRLDDLQEGIRDSVVKSAADISEAVRDGRTRNEKLITTA